MSQRGTGPHDLDALREVLAATDDLLAGWTCPAATDCCRFARTGREPFLWPNEWALLRQALERSGHRLDTFARPGDDARCPLLSADGRCRFYAVRPFGCRTYFCARAIGPTRRPPHGELARLGRRIAALAEHAEPDGEGPRALTVLLARRTR